MIAGDPLEDLQGDLLRGQFRGRPSLRPPCNPARSLWIAATRTWSFTSPGRSRVRASAIRSAGLE